MQRLESYKKPTRLKKNALSIMVKHLDANQTEEVRANFKLADKDNSGYLDKAEFTEYFQKSDSHDLTKE